MWHSVLNVWRSASAWTRPQVPRLRCARLCLEQLEDRLVPSNFTAATVQDLIADINASNQAGGTNTISLVAGNTFSLTAVDNTTDGATGLPVIAANDNLTIAGNGDTIARSSATGTPAFRLFDVAGGASLTLANLTLQGGLAFGSGVSAEGGAIYNQGALDLNGVTVQNNVAQGKNGITSIFPLVEAGQSAAGGGIYSSGTLTLEGGTKVQNNQALGGLGGAAGSRSPSPPPDGGRGGDGFGGGLYVSAGTATLTGVSFSSNAVKGGAGGNSGTVGGRGGDGFGGALDVAGGTVTLTSSTLSANSALGGRGGDGGGAYSVWAARGAGTGGNGFGGGMYTAGGQATLHSDNVTGNTAQGGAGGKGGRTGVGKSGLGEGGGLYINALATLDLDDFTLANTSKNSASTSNNDIYGSYTVIP